MVYFHALIGLVIFVFLAWRLIWPLRKKRALCIFLLILLGMGTFKFPLIRLLGGPRFFAPDLPGWGLHLAGVFHGWVVFTFVLLLAVELGTILWYGISFLRKRPVPSGKILYRVRVGAVCAACLPALIALWGGTCAPQVREIPLEFADLPAGADGMRIAVLSDIHVSPTVRAPRVREFVRLANETKPDLILILGDFLDGSVADIREDIAPLGELSAPHGVLAVTGNHEYYYNFPQWRQEFRKLGILMLENQWTGIRGIRFAGITDPAGRKFGEPAPSLKKALAGAANHFTILLAHRPKYAPEAAKLGARLQLSGHTHGGSVIGLKSLVKRYNGGFVAGQYQVGDMLLLISNGTGIWSGMPLRLGAPSEILLLELRKKK